MSKYKSKVIYNYDFVFSLQKVSNHIGIGINYMHNRPRRYGIIEFPRSRGIEVAIFTYHFVLTWAKHISS